MRKSEEMAPLSQLVAGQFKVAEGISSTFYYHLQRDDQRVCESLCGAEVFQTQIPLATWGLKTHLQERYCPTCEEIARTAPGKLVLEVLAILKDRGITATPEQVQGWADLMVTRAREARGKHSDARQWLAGVKHNMQIPTACLHTHFGDAK